jgi:Zn-dependent alcohol dehydrogenase
MQDIEHEIHKELKSHSPDLVIETTGAREMIELAYNLILKKGQVVLVGVPKHNEPVSIDTLPLHFNSKIIGSKGGQTKPEIDIPKYIRLAEQGIYRFDKMKIELFRLSEINKAIFALQNTGVGRIVIKLCD